MDRHVEANSYFFEFLQTHKGTGSLHTDYRHVNESRILFLVACYHLNFLYHKKTHANCVLLKC